MCDRGALALLSSLSIDNFHLFLGKGGESWIQAVRVNHSSSPQLKTVTVLISVHQNVRYSPLSLLVSSFHLLKLPAACSNYKTNKITCLYIITMDKEKTGAVMSINVSIQFLSNQVFNS